MFRNMKLSTKILGMITTSVLMLALMFVWLYPQMQKSLMDEKRAKTMNLVETAWSIVDHYATQAANGTLDEGAAKQQALATVKSLRYMGSNYFWINDVQPTMIMHPIKPKLDGKDLSGFKDPNGKKLFVEMASVGKQKGEGFVDYFWAKPGEQEPVSKVSYVKMHPKWGWIVGSGIYVDDVQKELHKKFGFIFGFVAVILVLCLVGGYFGTRTITRPLNNVITGLNASSTMVSDAAEQVSTSSNSLASGTSQQAASIEETSASLEEISAMTRQNAGNAQEVNALMAEAKSIVERSSQSMRELTTSMQDIAASSEETQKIIKTIDDIAFQTNLLSLNAAVEAARAGEAGAGFAVVADEVRNLAMRASDAAQNTSGLIENSVKKIMGGNELVQKCNADFEEIAESSQKVAVLVDEIATAANEQSQGVGQISTAVNEMDKVTQGNAATAEESAAAAQELDALSIQLKQAVIELQQVVGGQEKVENLQYTRNESPAHAVPIKKKKSAGERMRSLEEIIPLDDDPDSFQDFSTARA